MSMTGEILPYFRPSRRFRRQFAGQPCPGCGNRVDPKDLVTFAPGGGRTYHLHESCLGVLTELANGAAADSTGAEEEETHQESTAADPIVHAIMDPEEGSK